MAKYLDSAGVKALWLATKNLVSSQSSTDTSALAVSVVQDSTLKYHITQGGKKVGIDINIPKDMVVSSGEVIKATGSEKQGSGASAASANLTKDTKYIKLTLSNAPDTSDYVYIAVTDLVNDQVAGNGIDVNGNKISIKLDTKSDSYLSVGADGLKLSGVEAAITSARTAATTAANNAITTAEKYTDDRIGNLGTVSETDTTKKTVKSYVDSEITKLSSQLGTDSVSTQITDAINKLDYTDNVEGDYVSAVNQTDGKISVTKAKLPTSLKNPNALTVGAKSYDGSAAVTITKSDLGLGNVTDGAEVNQNAFSKVTVDGTTISASAKTDTITIAASGSVTASASGKVVTISSNATADEPITFNNKPAATATVDDVLIELGDKTA